MARKRVVVARHGVAAAVPAPFVVQRPAAPRKPPRCGRRMFGHVGQLLAHRAVGRSRRGAFVDRRGPRVGAVEIQSPVAGQRYGEVRLQFDAAGMDFLEVARREEAFGCR